MIYMFDYQGTFNEGSREAWKALGKFIRDNGDYMCLATTGPFGKEEQETCGITEDFFDRIYPNINKNPELIQKIADDFEQPVENICVVDDNHMNVMVLGLITKHGIFYNNIEEITEVVRANQGNPRKFALH